MRIAEVVGTVTLNRSVAEFTGARLKLAVPLSLAQLTGEQPSQGADLTVCWDELGAGIGSRIALTEGPEAAQPFRPQLIPVDAYAAALLDHVEVTGGRRAGDSREDQIEK